MKKYFYLSSIALFFILVSGVFAAGGGGGGSVPSCSADQWDCTGWSQCSPEGSQSRVCTMTFDCSSASTPKPQETQSCDPPVPPPAPPPTPPSVPQEIPQQETPPVQPATPACEKDTFTCTNWSASCNSIGREHRTCTMSFDCPEVQTPPPADSQRCQKLQCGNKETLRDRILCRLNLAPAGVARELEIQYLPEACKQESGHEKDECIENYKSFQPCWNVKEGAERFSCARNVLKLGPSIADQANICKAKTGNDQVDCKHELKDKILYMITFRFYDLETRAEALADRGANLETVADFETIVELKKQEFYKAETNAQRLQIILEVRKAWRDFVNTVKEQIL